MGFGHMAVLERLAKPSLHVSVKRAVNAVLVQKQQ